MSQMETVHSVEEFRHLYYPDADPALDYLDGEPDDARDEAHDTIVVVDPLDRFGREKKSPKNESN